MTPSQKIDKKIANLKDWRGKTLAGVRTAILAADRGIVEEWKWMGSPVWSKDGILVVGNAHKEKVKLTFAHGAKLDDPDGLFNAGFGGGTWRAIDLHQGDKINAPGLKKLIRAAIAFNAARKTAKAVKKKAVKKKPAPRT
jgi:hypothetical protein